MNIHRVRVGLNRSTYALVAAVLAVGAILPIVTSNNASAALIESRSIKMSSTVVSATGVTYELKFTPPSAGAESFVLDFCTESPIKEGTCTLPTGLTTASATLSSGPASWTVASLSATTLEFASNAATALAANTSVTFVIASMENPDAAGTFYARMYTYAAEAASNDYTSPTAVGTELDDGGFALSTSNSVSVTATVAESLTFCVSEADPGADCTATTAPTLELGHGTPLRLDDSATDTAIAYTQTSTNASGGVIIRMKNSNTCGGLSKDGGTTCEIAASNSGSATPAAIGAGEAEFGLNVVDSAGETGANIAADANYSGASVYGMDTTTAGSNVTTTYGDVIASATGATADGENTLTFAARASGTTPSGTYTATMVLVATSTF